MLVYLADQLCLRSDSGYGYELREEDIIPFKSVWQLLVETLPAADRVTPEDYAAVVASAIAGAQDLADRFFGPLPLPN